MTQKQLADKIHVTDKAISKWERGVGIPDITNLEALADALELRLPNSFSVSGRRRLL